MEGSFLHEALGRATIHESLPANSAQGMADDVRADTAYGSASVHSRQYGAVCSDDSYEPGDYVTYLWPKIRSAMSSLSVCRTHLCHVIYLCLPHRLVYAA